LEVCGEGIDGKHHTRSDCNTRNDNGGYEMSLDQVSALPDAKPPPETSLKKQGTKKPRDIEAILREEIRVLRELWMRILQWGVTVMIAAGSVIFYASTPFC
jgi:hypothetical protein